MVEKNTRATLVVSFVFLMVFATASCPAQSIEQSIPADTVILNNNDRISGRILKATPQLLEIEHPALGALTINWDKIASVTSGNRNWRLSGHNAPKQSGHFQTAVLQLREHSLVLVADSRVIPVDSEGEIFFEEPSDSLTSRSQVAPSPAPAAAHANRFQINLSAPESVVNGTTSQNNLGGTVRLFLNETEHPCDPPALLTTLVAGASNTKSWKVGGAPVVTNIYDGTLTVLQAVSQHSRTAYVGTADFFGNSSLGIALQQSYGGGLSSVLYSNDCAAVHPHHSVYFVARGDVRYVKERLYAPSIPLSFGASQIGEEFTYSFRNAEETRKFSVSANSWIMPPFDGLHALQAYGGLRFSLPVLKNLSIDLTEEDNYLNNPPKGKRRNFLKSSAGLTFSFSIPKK